jgi:glucan biosynthesis protein C
MHNTNAGGRLQGLGREGRRLHYLDWIRVLAVLGVFFYHATLPFDTTDWLINNADQTMVLTILTGFLFPFGMPVFFLVAGINSWLSLQRRTARQYVIERLRRLLIPFIVGSLMLSPIQLYLEWRHKGWFEGPFVDLLGKPNTVLALLERGYPLGFGPEVIGAVGVHLWFLGFLFAYSLLALPFFLWLRQGAGRRVLAWLVGLAERRGGTGLFVVPLVFVMIVLQPTFTLHRDWPEFVFMLVFFAAGHVLYADPRLTESVWRDQLLILILAMLSYLILLPAAASGVIFTWMESPGSAGFALFWSAFSAGSWFWATFLLCRATRQLDFRNAWLEYGLEASVPFYLLHHPVMVAIAYHVVQWDASIPVKLAVVAVSSFVLSLGLYELLIRRCKPLRALLGMKPLASDQ